MTSFTSPTLKTAKRLVDTMLAAIFFSADVCFMFVHEDETETLREALHMWQKLHSCCRVMRETHKYTVAK